ncbi:MAG: hypothetical protein ACR2QT_11080 [Woeseiaceae bacterium]
MTKRFKKSKFALTGGITALLLSVCCSVVLADHGLIDAAADMKDPAAEPTEEKLPSSALAEVKTTSSSEVDEEAVEPDVQATPVSDRPGIAVRLPGVSEKDQPRFRRQMNRTDI